MKNILLHLLLAGMLLCSLPIQAQVTININPQKDNTLYENENGAISNGAGDHFFVGETNLGQIRRALLKFDIASIVPSGATILDATLTLIMDQTISGTSQVELHTVSADWGEGTSVATGNGGIGITAQTNDATWLHTFYNTSLWSKAGGDFNPVVSATTPVNAVSTYSWTSPQLIADVQKWLNEPTTNFGWCLTGDEANMKTAKRFASREIANTNNSPRLSITYKLPVSVQEANTAPRCSFFPNPSSGIMQLAVYNVSHPKINIFNGMGKTVYAQTDIEGQLLIDIHKEPAGIYFYQLLSNDRLVETGKIMISK